MERMTFSGIGYHAVLVGTVLPAFCLWGLAGPRGLSTASDSKPKR